MHLILLLYWLISLHYISVYSNALPVIVFVRPTCFVACQKLGVLIFDHLLIVTPSSYSVTRSPLSAMVKVVMSINGSQRTKRLSPSGSLDYKGLWHGAYVYFLA